MRQRDAISLKRILILARQRFAPRQFFSIEIQFSHGARPIFCRSGIFLASGGIGFHRRAFCPTISFRLSVYKRRLLIRVFRVSRNKGGKKDAFPRGRELLPGRLLQRNVTEESRDTCVRAHVSAMETKRVETDGRGTSSRFIDALKSRTRHRFVSSSDKAF